MNPTSDSRSALLAGWTARWPLLLNGILVVVFALGLGIRLLDLDDPPMGFNPSRQLRGAIIARGLYYQMLPEADPSMRQQAIELKNGIVEFEPPILEAMVAAGYRLLGGERLWLPVVLNSLFWLLGGWFLYDLARRAASVEAAIFALAFYLYLPFSVVASRSFQPDPFMVFWLILFVYAVVRWSEDRGWRWTLLTALFAGSAVLVKVVAAYMVAAVMLAVVLGVIGLRAALKDKRVWVMALVMIAPAAIYYLVLLNNDPARYYQRWGGALSSLILKPGFYFQWADRLESLINLAFIFAAWLGVLLSRPRLRAVLIGLWVGYLVYGLSLPHLISTHDYYSLQLVPIVALSLLPLADLLMRQIAQQPRLWQAAAAAVLAFFMFLPLWNARTALLGQDFRHEPEFWAYIGAALPENGRIIALTQHYGHPIAYYGWKRVALWPTSQEFSLAELRATEREYQQLFTQRIQNNDFFLVTTFGQLSRQPQLEQTLAAYPVYVEGAGFVIYDLRQPPAEAQP